MLLQTVISAPLKGKDGGRERRPLDLTSARTCLRRWLLNEDLKDEKFPDEEERAEEHSKKGEHPSRDMRFHLLPAQKLPSATHPVLCDLASSL